MGVLDGRADLPEEFKTGGDAQPVGLGVFGDGLAALDVLHGEVREAVTSDAAIEQLSDVRVLEAGKDLTLLLEALQDDGGVHAAADKFDGNALLKLVVIADGKEDGSHASTANWLEDAVGTGELSDEVAALVGPGV
ncbi:MAG: hypothetical protein IANPNBLG_00304 [Bryobacteraceae bacterium]|nr:hypothetical protein [Bryobacteraceae bacterium]